MFFKNDVFFRVGKLILTVHFFLFYNYKIMNYKMDSLLYI